MTAEETDRLRVAADLLQEHGLHVDTHHLAVLLGLARLPDPLEQQLDQDEIARLQTALQREHQRFTAHEQEGFFADAKRNLERIDYYRERLAVVLRRGKPA